MRLLRSARNDVVDDSFVFSYFRVFVIKIDLLCVLCVEDKNTFGKPEWGSGHAILLIFMDYRSKNRCFLLLTRYFQG